MNTESKTPLQWQAYECGEVRSGSLEWLFNAVVVASLAACIGFGAYLKTVKLKPRQFDDTSIAMVETHFEMQQKKAAPKKVEQPKAEKPVDLTKPAELNQKQEQIQPDPGTVTRRVYGLRKVYSVGLGAAAGGTMGQAVIGKLGNTLEKDVDTLKAAPQDLQGKLVSVTTVTAMPVLKDVVKPEYNQEMLKNRVEGVVSAKLLIDVDGKVKDIVLLNDLGFGSAELALAAFRKLVFKPALQGDAPVAVWIVMKLKFVLEK